MNVFPVISRELRAEARNPVNYILRTFGASLLLMFLGIFLWQQQTTQSGDQAFFLMSCLIFSGIWIVVPLVTADCLSREKREGTLGLLFLTPLRPIEIILGKGAIHAIRSITLILAATPILTVPFILGGITNQNVIASLLLDLVALLGALSAGLLASSFCRQWTSAVILAEFFAFLLLLLFIQLSLSAISSAFGLTSGSYSEIGYVLRYIFVTGGFNGHGSPANISFSQLSSFFSLIVGMGFATFATSILFASFQLKRRWQDNPPSPTQRWIRKVFCTPRFWVGLLHSMNQRRLSKNPIGWLQQYSWTARMSKWSWCAVVISFVSWLLSANFSLVRNGCVFLEVCILVSMAFSAVGSFQREKQNGALELLLVTPLRENQIIFGRLRGIWDQFLPAFGILFLSFFFSGNFYSHYRREEVHLSFWIIDFLAVPIVGLYYALRLKSFLFAWLMTCTVTLILPYIALAFISRMTSLFVFDSGEGSPLLIFIRMAISVFAATLALIFLQKRIKNRSFVLGPT